MKKQLIDSITFWNAWWYLESWKNTFDAKNFAHLTNLRYNNLSNYTTKDIFWQVFNKMCESVSRPNVNGYDANVLEERGLFSYFTLLWKIPEIAKIFSTFSAIQVNKEMVGLDLFFLHGVHSQCVEKWNVTKPVRIDRIAQSLIINKGYIWVSRSVDCYNLGIDESELVKKLTKAKLQCSKRVSEMKVLT